MSLLLQEAARKSAARSKKIKEQKLSPPPPAAPSVPDPEGIIKKASNETPYRVYTIPLADLPRFLERKKLEQFILYKNGENRYMNPDLSSFASHRSYMIEVFRLAIPEIEEGADLVFVHSNPWRRPVPGMEGPKEGEPIELRKYDIPGPYPTRFSFSIAYLPEERRVLVLRIPIEELPVDMSHGGEYYIIQYVQKEEPKP